VTEEDIRRSLVAVECEAAQTARTALALRTLLDVDPAQAASARLHMRVELLGIHSARLRDETGMLWLEVRRPWWRRWLGR
jgi:hypothetical protein